MISRIFLLFVIAAAATKSNNLEIAYVQWLSNYFREATSAHIGNNKNFYTKLGMYLYSSEIYLQQHLHLVYSMQSQFMIINIMSTIWI